MKKILAILFSTIFISSTTLSVVSCSSNLSQFTEASDFLNEVESEINENNGMKRVSYNSLIRFSVLTAKKANSKSALKYFSIDNY